MTMKKNTSSTFSLLFKLFVMFHQWKNANTTNRPTKYKQKKQFLLNKGQLGKG